MGKTLDEIKHLTYTCWNEKLAGNQTLTNDMSHDKHTGRYRLGSNSSFSPNGSQF